MKKIVRGIKTSAYFLSRRTTTTSSSSSSSSSYRRRRHNGTGLGRRCDWQLSVLSNRDWVSEARRWKVCADCRHTSSHA